jgi:hypothetical protein
LLTKILIGAATLVAAVGVAAPANADPNLFGTLSCNCTETVSVETGLGADPIQQGMQSGLAEVRSVRAQQ